MSAPNDDSSVLATLGDTLRSIFSIACNTYSLNPHQLWHIRNSMEAMNGVAFDYDKAKTESYIEHYNILARLLNNVQTVGNVFTLDDAGRVFKALSVLKTYIESSELTDEVDTSYEFIKCVVNRCFFDQLIYSFDQLDRIVKSTDILVGRKLTKNADENCMGHLTFLREMIDLAQAKGRFTLDHANTIITVTTELKRDIILANVEKHKAAEAERAKEAEAKAGKAHAAEKNGEGAGEAAAAGAAVEVPSGSADGLGENCADGVAVAKPKKRAGRGKKEGKAVK
jgi:hypothetical protein